MYQRFYFAIIMLLIIQSCGIDDSPFKIKEAPSIYNNPKIMGYNMEDLTYENLTKTASFTGETPWTDSFWPIYLGGLTWRYNFADQTKPRFPAFKAFFTDFFDRMATKKPEKISQLSPAEKYNILSFDPSKQKAIMRLVSKIDKSYKKDQDEYFEFAKGSNKELEDLHKKLGEANEEEKDYLNSKIQAIYKKNGMAEKRVILGLYSQLLKADLLREHLPLVLDGWVGWSYYAGRGNYSVGGKQEGIFIDWSWMGHCHGWAPAAIYEKKPKNAVMITKDDMQLLFTEGDIRGLLSKAWANQASAGHFLGLRCNEIPGRIAINETTGRVLDGLICDQDDRTCIERFTTASSATQNYFGDFRKEVLYIPQDKPLKIYSFNEYSVTSEPTESQNYKLARKINSERQFMVRYSINTGIRDLPEFGTNVSAIDIAKENSFAAYIFNSKIDIVTTIKSNSWHSKKQKYFYLIGCRDVNAASFHIALANFLVDEKKGSFVMDRVPSSEVWNQPVAKFELKAGELIDVRTASDALQENRAYGTKYLVEVTGDVSYEEEPLRPYAKYAIADGRDLDEMLLTKAPITYTLEFDYDKKLLGGEWGNLTDMESRSPALAPDFLYWYNKGEKPRKQYVLRSTDGSLLGLFNLEFLNKIHDCSIDESLEVQKIKIPAFELQPIPDDPQLQEVFNEELEIDYVQCPI